MATKIIEFIVLSNRDFNSCPLAFQNTIYTLLEKFKREGKKIKIQKDTDIGKTIRNDALTLIKLPIVNSEVKSDFLIKIFDASNPQKNEGLNISITEENVKITKLKT